MYHPYRADIRSISVSADMKRLKYRYRNGSESIVLLYVYKGIGTDLVETNISSTLSPSSLCYSWPVDELYAAQGGFEETTLSESQYHHLFCPHLLQSIHGSPYL